MTDGVIGVAVVPSDIGQKQLACELSGQDFMPKVVEKSAASMLTHLQSNDTSTIDTVHRSIHKGEFFSGGVYLPDVADQAYVDIRVLTSTLDVHCVVSGMSGGDSLISFYEGTTFSNIGTAITMSNHNRGSVKTSGVSVTSSPTVDSLGSGINGVRYIPGGTKSGSGGGEGGFGAEYVLKANTAYLFRMQNIASASKRMSQMIEFYIPGL